MPSSVRLYSESMTPWSFTWAMISSRTTLEAGAAGEYKISVPSARMEATRVMVLADMAGRPPIFEFQYILTAFRPQWEPPRRRLSTLGSGPVSIEAAAGHRRFL